MRSFVLLSFVLSIAHFQFAAARVTHQGKRLERRDTSPNAVLNFIRDLFHAPSRLDQVCVEDDIYEQVSSYTSAAAFCTRLINASPTVAVVETTPITTVGDTYTTSFTTTTSVVTVTPQVTATVTGRAKRGLSKREANVAGDVARFMRAAEASGTVTDEDPSFVLQLSSACNCLFTISPSATTSTSTAQASTFTQRVHVNAVRTVNTTTTARTAVTTVVFPTTPGSVDSSVSSDISLPAVSASVASASTPVSPAITCPSDNNTTDSQLIDGQLFQYLVQCDTDITDDNLAQYRYETFTECAAACGSANRGFNSAVCKGAVFYPGATSSNCFLKKSTDASVVAAGVNAVVLQRIEVAVTDSAASSTLYASATSSAAVDTASMLSSIFQDSTTAIPIVTPAPALAAARLATTYSTFVSEGSTYSSAGAYTIYASSNGSWYGEWYSTYSVVWSASSTQEVAYASSTSSSSDSTSSSGGSDGGANSGVSGNGGGTFNNGTDVGGGGNGGASGGSSSGEWETTSVSNTTTVQGGYTIVNQTTTVTHGYSNGTTTTTSSWQIFETYSGSSSGSNSGSASGQNGGSSGESGGDSSGGASGGNNAAPNGGSDNGSSGGANGGSSGGELSGNGGNGTVGNGTVPVFVTNTTVTTNVTFSNGTEGGANGVGNGGNGGGSAGGAAGNVSTALIVSTIFSTAVSTVYLTSTPATFSPSGTNAPRSGTESIHSPSPVTSGNATATPSFPTSNVTISVSNGISSMTMPLTTGLPSGSPLISSNASVPVTAPFSGSFPTDLRSGTVSPTPYTYPNGSTLVGPTGTASFPSGTIPLYNISSGMYTGPVITSLSASITPLLNSSVPIILSTGFPGSNVSTISPSSGFPVPSGNVSIPLTGTAPSSSFAFPTGNSSTPAGPTATGFTPTGTVDLRSGTLSTIRPTGASGTSYPLTNSTCTEAPPVTVYSTVTGAASTVTTTVLGCDSTCVPFGGKYGPFDGAPTRTAAATSSV